MSLQIKTTDRGGLYAQRIEATPAREVGGANCFGGREGAFVSFAILAAFLAACAASSDEPFTGPYPVDDVLVEIDNLDAHYCECAIAETADPPNTVAECDADYPSSWAPGTPKRFCLAQLGRQDEWRDSHIFSCMQLGIDDAHDRLCDYVDNTNGRISFLSGAAAPCGDLWTSFNDAMTECTLALAASSGESD